MGLEMSLFSYEQSPKDIIESILEKWKSWPRDIHALVPSRKCINPKDIEKYLSFVGIFSRKGYGQYTVSLAGSGFCHFYGAELKGENLDDIHEDHQKSYIKLDDKIYEEITQFPCGLHVKRSAKVKLTGECWGHESLSLPVCDDAGTLNAFFYAMRFYPVAEAPESQSMPRFEDLTDITVLDVEYIDIGAGVPK